MQRLPFTNAAVAHYEISIFLNYSICVCSADRQRRSSISMSCLDYIPSIKRYSPRSPWAAAMKAKWVGNWDHTIVLVRACSQSTCETEKIEMCITHKLSESSLPLNAYQSDGLWFKLRIDHFNPCLPAHLKSPRFKGTINYICSTWMSSPLLSWSCTYSKSLRAHFSCHLMLLNDSHDGQGNG